MGDFYLRFCCCTRFSGAEFLCCDVLAWPFTEMVMKLLGHFNSAALLLFYYSFPSPFKVHGLTRTPFNYFLTSTLHLRFIIDCITLTPSSQFLCPQKIHLSVSPLLQNSCLPGSFNCHTSPNSQKNFALMEQFQCPIVLT